MSKLLRLTDLNDLRTLRGLYEKNSERASPIGFHLLDNFLKWFERDPNLRHVNVYTYDESWYQNGRYLIVDRYALFLNSLIPADEKLGIAIQLLDWSRGYKITALPEAQYTVIANTLREMNIEWRQVKLHVRRLSTEKAREFQISSPNDFVLRSLHHTDAAIINSYWYSQQAGSLFFFERLIKHNLSMGIYRRDTQELIAWCTQCQNGFLASLFVKENYRRCGFAELIIKGFSYRQANANANAEQSSFKDILSAVSVSNPISNGLLHKMGFEVATDVYHLVAYRAPQGMEWPLNDDCSDDTN